MFSITRDAAPSPSSWSPCHWPWISPAGMRRRPAPASPWRRAPRSWPRTASARRSGPPVEARTPTGLAPLDALLDGGFPQGQLAELVGPRTSGRTRVLLGALAGVTARGGWAALVDGTDGLDPAAAAMLGVPLGRLLWVRCGGRLATAWRAADVLVQRGGFELVVVDLGDLPPWALARTPPAVFVRLQRAVERAATGLLIAGPRRVAGSLAAVAVALVPRAVHWAPGGPGLLAGLETEARLVRSRTRAPGAGVRLAWTALDSERAAAGRARAARPRGGGPRSALMAAASSMGRARYACAWVPGFAAAALVRQDPALRGRPVAALRGATLRTVVAVTPEAAAGGARRGMSATEAATRVPDLVGRAEDPAAERAAAGALLDAAWATSPRVEVLEPGSLCLDLARARARSRGRAADRRAAGRGGRAVGLPVRVGIGATRTLARLAARLAAGLLVVPPGGEEAFLAPRALGLLDPAPDLGLALERWGIGTLGALAALPTGGAPRAPRPGRRPAPGARARRGCRTVRAPPRARALPRSGHARLGGAVAPRARLRPRPAPRAARGAPRPPRGRARPRFA